MIRLPRPAHADMDTLHAEVDVLGLGSYSIEWYASALCFRFDREPSSAAVARLADIVAAHDGSAIIAKREEEASKVAAIQTANAALLAVAKEKRLAGQALGQNELAALVDAVLFPRT